MRQVPCNNCWFEEECNHPELIKVPGEPILLIAGFGLVLLGLAPIYACVAWLVATPPDTTIHITGKMFGLWIASVTWAIICAGGGFWLMARVLVTFFFWEQRQESNPDREPIPVAALNANALVN